MISVKHWKASETMAGVPADQDIKSLLMLSLFGSQDDPYKCSARRAYLDFCRTLRKKNEKETRKVTGQAFPDGTKETKEAAEGYLLEEVRGILARNCSEYDEWHRSVCEELRRRYEVSIYDFTIGQAQKWVNMTMKYLCVFRVPQAIAKIECLHVPLDSYVFQAAEEQFGLEPLGAWSKLTSYDEYIDYQSKIREATKVPLLWEFGAWNEIATRHK